MQVVRVDQRQQQSQQQQQTYPELFRLLTVGVNWDEIEDTLDFQQVNNEHSDHYGGEEEHADVVVDDDNNNNNDDDNNNNNASDGVYFVDAVTGRTALHLAVANEKERAKVIHRRCSQTLEATSNKGGEPTATTDATAVTGTPSSSLSRLRVIKKLHPDLLLVFDNGSCQHYHGRLGSLGRPCHASSLGTSARNLVCLQHPYHSPNGRSCRCSCTSQQITFWSTNFFDRRSRLLDLGLGPDLVAIYPQMQLSSSGSSDPTSLSGHACGGASDGLSHALCEFGHASLSRPSASHGSSHVAIAASHGRELVSE